MNPESGVDVLGELEGQNIRASLPCLHNDLIFSPPDCGPSNSLANEASFWTVDIRSTNETVTNRPLLVEELHEPAWMRVEQIAILSSRLRLQALILGLVKVGGFITAKARRILVPPPASRLAKTRSPGTCVLRCEKFLTGPYNRRGTIPASTAASRRLACCGPPHPLDGPLN